MAMVSALATPKQAKQKSISNGKILFFIAIRSLVDNSLIYMLAVLGLISATKIWTKNEKSKKNRMIVIKNKRPTSTKMQAYIPFIK